MSFGRKTARPRKEVVVGSSDKLLILGLPRGGVPHGPNRGRRAGGAAGCRVSAQVGRALAAGARLRRSRRKTGCAFSTPQLIRDCALESKQVEEIVAREQEEIARRSRLFPADAHPPKEIRGRDLIVVDDGLATGSTTAGGRSSAAEAPAAAHCGRDSSGNRNRHALCCGKTRMKLLCLSCPEPFESVGSWSRRFHPGHRSGSPGRSGAASKYSVTVDAHPARKHVNPT